MKLSWLRSRRFWLLTITAILITLIGSQLPLDEWFLRANKTLASMGVWALPTFILAYLIATVLGLPNIILILVGGSLFGVLKGTIASSAADIVGAMICFGIGRTFARQWIKRWLQKNPRFIQIDQAVEHNGWKVLLLTRLSPLVPSSMLNYGFSCTRVNVWHYAFFSWLGMLPVIALYTYMGSLGTYLLSNEITAQKAALQGAGLVLAIAAALYSSYLVRKALIHSKV